MSFFISEAFAQEAATAAAPATPGITSFIPLILIFVVFYFLLVRPQQKKMKDHQNLLNELKTGDKVYTTGGIYGTVRAINTEENIVDLEIADDVVVKIIKQNIAEVLNKKDKNSDKPQKNNKK